MRQERVQRTRPSPRKRRPVAAPSVRRDSTTLRDAKRSTGDAGELLERIEGALARGLLR